MKKKTLVLSVILTLSAVLGANAYVVPNATQVETPFQKEMNKLVHEAVAQNLSTSVHVPKEVQLDLNQTVQLALAQNYDVRKSLDDYEAANAKVSLAGAVKNPTINVGYKANRSGGEVGLTNPRIETPLGTMKLPSPAQKEPIAETTGTALSVSLPIYTGGAASSSLEMARYGREISLANVNKVKEETKLAAAKSYFDVIRAKNMAAIADLAVKDLEAHLRIVNLSYKVGIVAKSDVLSTEVLMSNMKTNQIKAYNAVNLAQAALSRQLAMPVDTKIDIKDKEFAFKKYDITLEDATAYALLHRSEVYMATLAERVAKAQIKVAEAGYKPKIQVSASKSWGHTLDKSKEISMLNPKTGVEEKRSVAIDAAYKNDWSVGIGATWNLWDGGTTAANVRAAKAAYEGSKETTRGAISGVSLDVRQAYLNLREAESTITNTKAAVAQAEENLRIASLRYNAGVGTNIDVLDADLKLSQARNDYVNALYAYNLNVATLEKAMGTPVDLAVGEGLATVKANEATKDLSALIDDAVKHSIPKK